MGRKTSEGKKRLLGECLLCGESDYALLDSHRAIMEGKDGGKYRWENLMVCCASCHRLMHKEGNRVLGRHLSTSGRYVWHLLIDGEEKWVNE